jgi:hypothetical protein
MTPFSTNLEVIQGIAGHGQMLYSEGLMGAASDINVFLQTIFTNTPSAIILNVFLSYDFVTLNFYGTVVYYVPGTSFGAEFSLYTPGTF